MESKLEMQLEQQQQQQQQQQQRWLRLRLDDIKTVQRVKKSVNGNGNGNENDVDVDICFPPHLTHASDAISGPDSRASTPPIACSRLSGIRLARRECGETMFGLAVKLSSVPLKRRSNVTELCSRIYLQPESGQEVAAIRGKLTRKENQRIKPIGTKPIQFQHDQQHKAQQCKSKRRKGTGNTESEIEEEEKENESHNNSELKQNQTQFSHSLVLEPYSVSSQLQDRDDDTAAAAAAAIFSSSPQRNSLCARTNSSSSSIRNMILSSVPPLYSLSVPSCVSQFFILCSHKWWYRSPFYPSPMCYCKATLVIASLYRFHCKSYGWN